MLRLPGNARTFEYADVDGSLIIPEHPYSLELIQPLSAPPLDSDNSPVARAARAPRFLMKDAPTDVNQSSLQKLLYALFTHRPSDEVFQIVIPSQSVRDAVLSSGLGISHPSSADSSVLLLRSTFWQGALMPRFHVLETSSQFPLTYSMTSNGTRHPVRAPKPPLGAVVYERWIPHLKEIFTLRTADHTNPKDLKAFNEWHNNPRVAAAWGATGTLQEHKAYLERLNDDAHVLTVYGAFDGEICMYFEIYWVAEDVLAPFVSHLHDWDRGFHLLVGDERYRGRHRVQAWLPSLIHYMFLTDTRTQRVMLEPRLSNKKVIDYMCNYSGFAITKFVDFPHKRSALLEVTRERFFQLSPFHPSEDVA